MMHLRSFVLACVCAAFLGGCGASGTAFPPAANANVPLGAKGSQTFKYTGKKQHFTVPAGVTRVTITADGASGGQCTSSCDGYGTPGNGGYVKATIPVTPGERLFVFVGGHKGYNGGATGSSSYSFGNGGGASDVREGGTGLKDRVIVAGGGGGGGLIIYWPSIGDGGNGGQGGGRAGTSGGYGSGDDTGGQGGGAGTQHGGGAGGAGGQYKMKPLCGECGHCDGLAGAAGTLGSGGAAATYCGGPGGGGGGGYNGGGGGGSGAGSYFKVSVESGGGGGGGGGSSFVEHRAFNVKQRKGGAPAGNGRVVIGW